MQILIEHIFQFISTEWLSCRFVLNIMVIFGFMLNYALRVNLTIALVDMIATPSNDTILSNETLSTVNATIASVTEAVADDGKIRFNWSEKDKQLILGSFFWG